MSNQVLDENSKISFYGDALTIETFADKYTSKNLVSAKKMIETLLAKGEAELLNTNSSVQDCFNKIADEQILEDAVNSFNVESDMAKDAKATSKREGKLTYPEIQIAFSKYTDANNFMGYVKNTLRLKEVNITVSPAGSTVHIKNVTDSELNAINKYYTGIKVTHLVQDSMQSGVDTVTKSVEYASQNILAPAAQIGIKGIASLFRSAAKVGTKIGATAITATTQSIKQTKVEILSDPDVIRAANELVHVKDSLKRNTIGMKTNPGIKIIQ